MTSKFEGWEYTSQRGLGQYTKSGFTVFSNGFAWKVRKPAGKTYAVNFKDVAKAIALAERKIAAANKKTG